MRSQYDERVNILNDRIKEEKEAKEKEQLARKAAEEQAQKAEEGASKAEEEKIFLNIETLVEFGIKDKEIEQSLSIKFGMSTDQAKDWIRKYAEYKTNK